MADDIDSRRVALMARIVDELGGIVPTAYMAQVSVPTVYSWKRGGLVHQGKAAALLAKAALAVGLEVTVDQLVGLAEPPVFAPLPESQVRRGRNTTATPRREVGDGATRGATARLRTNPRRARRRAFQYASPEIAIEVTARSSDAADAPAVRRLVGAVAVGE